MTAQEKLNIKNELIDCLKYENEIQKIIIFGSFMHAEEPNDLDIAILQSSNEKYLSLAMKYRKKIRAISKRIPVDVIPFNSFQGSNSFFSQISSGEIIYEK
ncbi:nucleotidyltransferase domain-containing protein [bacterium]|nr:nucleotidyltransferase domain-containing protein [bacterium]